MTVAPRRLPLVLPPRAWLAACLALVPIAAASLSAAAPKKKPAKPASADSTDAAPAASSAAPEPEPPASAEPPPPAKTDAPPEAVPPAPTLPKDEEEPITATREDPNKRYYFVGLRYRGTVIPQFIMNLFVDEGATVYSNTIGAEFDIRKQGQSTIPWIVYTDYSMGDTLFHQKGQSLIDSNYSVVNSSLKAIYLGLDQLWSVPIDASHHWDFEFGFGVGVGVLFGDLMNDWVYQREANGMIPNGPLLASTGAHYVECMSNDVQVHQSCNSMNHTGADPQHPKVNGYVEPSWFHGGSVPVIFPHISFPQLSLRYKPIKQMEARLGVGFSLTGFWFGLSADYGLEKPDDKAPKASRLQSGLRDML